MATYTEPVRPLEFLLWEDVVAVVMLTVLASLSQIVVDPDQRRLIERSLKEGESLAQRMKASPRSKEIRKQAAEFAETLNNDLTLIGELDKDPGENTSSSPPPVRKRFWT